MKKNKLKIIQEEVEGLLKLLAFDATVVTSEDEENKTFKVQIETKEPAVLIGYHGETISAVQLILGIMVSKKLGDWVRIIVNVGDYREKREEALRRMALSAAQKAHFSNEAVSLTSLSAAERRIIHLVLKEHPEVETYSEGEGKERRLVIKPR